MNTETAKRFVLEHARPVDLAVYKYFFEDGPNIAVIRELKRYQNQDGGFGHGLELDCWNPNSSPITTNDAVITLFRVDALKCFMLAYELLLENHITQVIDLSELKMLISRRLSDAICKDIKKYGVEYVPVPSDFFAGSFSAFITPSMKPLIAAEQAVLERLQMEDGGFDITWEWGTDDSEFHQARSWWRPRLTIDKLLFDGMDK